MAYAAAAVQQEDDPEPTDAEPWVLEGWGDGPSVSEAAQQAALRLGPYVKNVPTTLVGLGAGGTRRVLSAGHQGRSPLKVSEARRKAGPGGAPGAQGERRASGPAGLAHANHTATATVRRIALQRSLEVGDESDVEPDYPRPPSAALPAPACPPRILPGQRAIPQQLRHTPQAGPSGPGTASGRLGRREPATTTGSSGVASNASAATAQRPAGAHPCGSSAADSGQSGSPRPPRSISAEAYHPAAGSASRVPQPTPGRTAPVQALHAGGPGAHHLPLAPVSAPLQPLPTHLEPLYPVQNRGSGGRAGARPSDSGAGPSDVEPPPRSSSFSALANGQPPGGLSEHQDLLSAASIVNHVAAQGAGLAAGPPPLPGLFPTGRRPSSFRVDGGLSGWDPDAPPVQGHPQSPAASAGVSNLSLWIGPTAAGSGTSGLQVGSAGSGRGSPLQNGMHRRDPLNGNSRLQRGTATPPAVLLDLVLAPERSSDRPSMHGGSGSASGPTRGATRGQAGGALHMAGQGNSQSASPDVMGGGRPPGFPVPDQDALTEFCASRAEMGSGGASQGAGAGLGTPTADARGSGAGSSSGMLAPLSVAAPMRVTSFGKMPTAVGRVS